MILKKCYVCKKKLTLSHFYKHPRMGDGYLGRCRECTAMYGRNFRKAKRRLEMREKENAIRNSGTV